jgi:hypothetical protein
LFLSNFAEFWSYFLYLKKSTPGEVEIRDVEGPSDMEVPTRTVVQFQMGMMVATRAAEDVVGVEAGVIEIRILRSLAILDRNRKRSS